MSTSYYERAVARTAALRARLHVLPPTITFDIGSQQIITQNLAQLPHSSVDRFFALKNHFVRYK